MQKKRNRRLILLLVCGLGLLEACETLNEPPVDHNPSKASEAGKKKSPSMKNLPVAVPVPAPENIRSEQLPPPEIQSPPVLVTPTPEPVVQAAPKYESTAEVDATTIGVVLPLTGKFASVGQKTLRGIEMGLGLTGTQETRLSLAIADSAGNPDTARKGVDELVKKDGVVAIIGSLLSKTAPAVASRASELGVPSINLSQKSNITDVGPNVYRDTLTSEMQIRFLVKTAMKNFGMKKFAILYPNDNYGVECANLFWDEVRARGGEITSVQIYNPKETDFRGVVQRLIGTYYLEDRAEEYKTKLKEWSKDQGHKSANRNTPPEDLLPPVIDFDAVFIPDEAKTMGQIAAMMSYNDVKKVTLLGTNLWNVPGLSKRAGNFAKNLLFVDSFVANDPEFQKLSFVREYQNLFGEDPGPFEIQGYDTALMLRQILLSGRQSRERVNAALAQTQSFQGALGPLSVLPNHEFLRPLVALHLNGAEVAPALNTH